MTSLAYSGLRAEQSAPTLRAGMEGSGALVEDRIGIMSNNDSIIPNTQHHKSFTSIHFKMMLYDLQLNRPCHRLSNAIEIMPLTLYGTKQYAG